MKSPAVKSPAAAMKSPAAAMEDSCENDGGAPPTVAIASAVEVNIPASLCLMSLRTSISC